MCESKFAGGFLLNADQNSGMAEEGGVLPDKVTILGPGNMTLPTEKLPVNVSRTAEQAMDEVPLRERLDTTETKRQHGRAQPPSADSLTQLLVQSVASGDGKLLEEVLRVTKEKVVMASVRKMPLAVVLPFLRKVSFEILFREY